MGSRALSLGVKRLRREADYSPPSSAEVKNVWSYTSTPPIRLHGVVLHTVSVLELPATVRNPTTSQASSPSHLTGYQKLFCIREFSTETTQQRNATIQQKGSQLEKKLQMYVQWRRGGRTKEIEMPVTVLPNIEDDHLLFVVLDLKPCKRCNK
jgi:hypothetical protein